MYVPLIGIPLPSNLDAGTNTENLPLPYFLPVNKSWELCKAFFLANAWISDVANWLSLSNIGPVCPFKPKLLTNLVVVEVVVNFFVYDSGVLPFKSKPEGLTLVLPVDLPDIKSWEDINVLFLDKAWILDEARCPSFSNVGPGCPFNPNKPVFNLSNNAMMLCLI